MKQLIVILVLIVLTVTGFLTIANFASYLAMLGLISVLVIAHELGHFAVAKAVGVKVMRFGFGLPIGPTLLEKKFGDTIYCVHPVLLGGYVAFPTEEDTDIPEDAPERFENVGLWQRTAIVLAGITVNFILGYLIMVFVIVAWGYPRNDVTIKQVLSPNSPAAQAGLIEGDRLLEADGVPVRSPDILVKALRSHANQPLAVLVEREGQAKKLIVTPNAEGRMLAELGLKHQYVRMDNPLAVMGSAYLFLQDSMVMNAQAMGEIFQGKRSAKEVSGPLGIVKMGGQIIQHFGIAEGLIVTALISVILAVMNLLPIPMLDGGHLIFIVWEKLFGRPMRKEFRERAMQLSFMVLMGLMVLILWNDVQTHILGN